MARTLQNLKLAGNIEFSWYSCNILRYCSKRCIVWFCIPENCPAQANRKILVQLYVKMQIFFEPPFWIWKSANHLSFLAMFFSPFYVLWWLRTMKFGMHWVFIDQVCVDCFVITRFLGSCSDFNLPGFSLRFYLGSWNFNQFWSDNASMYNLIKICCYNDLHFSTLYNIWTKSIRGQVQ